MRISLTIRDEVLAVLDERRGVESRPAYIEGLIMGEGEDKLDEILELVRGLKSMSSGGQSEFKPVEVVNPVDELPEVFRVTPEEAKKKLRGVIDSFSDPDMQLDAEDLVEAEREMKGISDEQGWLFNRSYKRIMDREGNLIISW